MPHSVSGILALPITILLPHWEFLGFLLSKTNRRTHRRVATTSDSSLEGIYPLNTSSFISTQSLRSTSYKQDTGVGRAEREDPD